MKPSFAIIGGVVLIAGASLIFVLNQNKPAVNSTTGSQTVNTAPENNETTLGSDMCAEFSKEWVASATGKNIIKAEAVGKNITTTCQYYVDENSFITLRLSNLSVESQKKGQQSLGRTITTNDKIKTEHFIVLQDNGIINGVYLVINPNKFMAVDRTSTKALSEEEIINFASKVAEKLNGS